MDWRLPRTSGSECGTPCVWEGDGLLDRQMPAGMLLRSYWEGSHISDRRVISPSMNIKERAVIQLSRPVRRDDFVNYGQWFQRNVYPTSTPAVSNESKLPQIAFA